MHDCFNWLSVLVLLPLEAFTGLIGWLSLNLVSRLRLQTGEDAPELLKVLTEPITKLLIQVCYAPSRGFLLHLLYECLGSASPRYIHSVKAKPISMSMVLNTWSNNTGATELW